MVMNFKRIFFSFYPEVQASFLVEFLFKNGYIIFLMRLYPFLVLAMLDIHCDHLPA